MVKYKIPELFLAFSSKDYDRVKRIIESGIDLECTWNSVTPLRFALRSKNRDIVALLVQNGVDVNRRSTDHMHVLEPPLAAACRMNDINLVQELLKSSKINVDQVDFMGRSGLYFSAANFNVELTQLLLDNGACSRLGTGNWNDPFYICTLGKRGMCQKARDTARVLIAAGCKAGVGALQWATRIGDQELFKQVIRSGYQMQNEDFLREASLYDIWPDDEKFRLWITELKNCPLTLKTLSCCCIRNVFIKRWSNVREEHARKLPLPQCLMDEILLY